MFLLWFTLCRTLCASWTWVCFLQQYGEMFSHCFFKWEFLFLSPFSLNSIMWMLVCLILSTKCLKLSSIFWLIFFFLVLRSGDFHYSVFLCLFLKYKCIYFHWRLTTLQCCSGSAAHWHESAAGAHVLPILRPRPPPPCPSLWVSPVHQQALLCVSAYWSVLWIIQSVDSSAVFFMSVIVFFHYNQFFFILIASSWRSHSVLSCFPW